MVQPIKVIPLTQLKMHDIQRQTLDYSCGAAALSILFSQYFLDPIEEKDILEDMIYRQSPGQLKLTMTKGFSMLDLKEVAIRLGYQSTGVKLDIESLHLLSGPVILLIRQNDLNHFVVLKGVDAGRAYIVNPATGHTRMPLFELERKWHGEALIIDRLGVSLPMHNKFSLPMANGSVPENHSVRALQHTPLN